jgi:hypothetical protein
MLKHKNSNTVTITNQEYTELSQYVNNLNKKFPIFYSILSTIIEEQDEQLINIKLPDKNNFSLKELSQINERIDKIFKEINIDGDYTFKGFDVGTSWYKILIIGELTYKCFIGGLEISQEYFKASQEYYKSGEARLHYETALKHTQEKKEISEEEIKKYANEVIQGKIESSIKKILDEVLVNKENEKENIVKIKKAIHSIMNELDKGIEFHLSLNPPKYVEECNNKIVINYEEIRKLETEKNTPKQIEEEKKNDE